MPRTIAEENWFFDFVEEDDGSYVLTVTCGTVAVYDVRVVLNAHERQRYVTQGHDVRELANKVLDRPNDYVARGR